MAEPDAGPGHDPATDPSTDPPAELIAHLAPRRQAMVRRLAALAEPTGRLRSYAAFAFWTLAGGGARRALDAAALTPAQRLAFLAAAHHADLTGGEPVTAASVAGLTALPVHHAQAALRRLARRGWLRTTVDGAGGVAAAYQMPAAAHAFVRDAVVEDPRLLGEPLIEVLTDRT
ncbi:hypothetical protein [Phytohabitans aurantiacus]|uniref:hypothetical protein n=1 Tax=Phytohabitans aurantiacus TaxID=3016789 RepID=UPI0024935DF2|nr:hypothetical protein [Phytohabitans aurantiacus]